MGLLLLSIIVALYVFIAIKAFYFKKSSEATSIAYFEVLKLNAKIILVASVILLAVVLIIHGGVFWGVGLFGNLFSFLSFVTPSSMDDLLESYVEQVSVIIFVVLLPYAKYSNSVVKKFKDKLFEFLLKKYDSDINIITKKQFAAISDLAFANNDFLKKVKQNIDSDKLKNSSMVNFDDTFYFPDKEIYITECTVETLEEVYRKDAKGKGKWKVLSTAVVFNGLAIIVPKDRYNPASTAKEPTLFCVDNPSASILSDKTRSDKKHNFILEAYYQYFRKGGKLTYGKQNFSDRIYGHFNSSFANYDEQSEELCEIAKKMNINYIMEDESYIYLFHNEENIDLFTFYQNEDVSTSLETFEKDFQLLLKISQEFK